MAFYDGKVHLVHRGTIDSVQTWSFGIYYGVIGSGSVVQGDLDTWLASVKTKHDTWFNTVTGGPKAIMGSNCTCVDLVAYYSVTPAAAPSLTSVVLSGNAGTVAPVHPPQVAAVYSLTDGTPGRSHRGRFYMPAGSLGSDGSTGRIASATCTSMINAFKTFNTAVELLPLAANAVGLALFPQNSRPSTGRVDNVFDTQRRRRDKVLPTFTASASL